MLSLNYKPWHLQAGVQKRKGLLDQSTHEVLPYQRHGGLFSMNPPMTKWSSETFLVRAYVSLIKDREYGTCLSHPVGVCRTRYVPRLHRVERDSRSKSQPFDTHDRVTPSPQKRTEVAYSISPASPTQRLGTLSRDGYTFGMVAREHFQYIKHCWETASKFICNLDRAWCSPNQASHLVRIAILYMLLHKRISYLWFAFGAQYMRDFSPTQCSLSWIHELFLAFP